MKKQTKSFIMATTMASTIVTPVMVSADTTTLLDEVTKEEFIKSHLGSGYKAEELSTYVNGVKSYFEDESEYTKDDVKILLDIIHNYNNIGSIVNKDITKKTSIKSLQNDIALVNYLNGILTQMTSKKHAQAKIMKDLQEGKQKIAGNKLYFADGSKTVNSVLDVVLTYVDNPSSQKRKKMEEAFKELHTKNDKGETIELKFTQELKLAVQTLKKNDVQDGDEVFAGVMKADVPSYKEENKEVYNYYYDKTEKTLDTKNADDYIESINYLIKATANTNQSNVEYLRTYVNKLESSAYKTVMEATTLSLEAMLKVTASGVDEKTKITDLQMVASKMDDIISQHYSTIQYDLNSHKNLISKIHHYATQEGGNKTEALNTVNSLLNLTNDLHSELKFLSITLLDKQEEPKVDDSRLELDDVIVDNNEVAKGYTSTARTNLANPFTDIDNVYSKDEILELFHNAQIVKGITDTEYRPFDKVTRGHFGVIIARAIGENANGKGKVPKDVKGQWYEKHISLLVSKGIMYNGTVGSDGRFKENKNIDTFNPDAGLQRKDMALYLVRMLKDSGFDVENLGMQSSLSDVDDNRTLTEEEKDAIRVLEALDIIHGKPDKTYSPFEVANRAQIAKVVYKVLELTGHIGQ